VLNADEYEPRTQLGHAEVAGIQDLPVYHIPEFPQAVKNLVAIRSKPLGSESAYVLDQHCPGVRFLDQAKRCREKVALIVRAKLPTGD